MDARMLLSIIGQVAPKVLLFTPLKPIAGKVAEAMVEAQGIPGATREEKLAHVKRIALQAAEATNAEAGHVVLDPALVEATAAESIAAAKAAAKLVHDTHLKLAPAAAAQGDGAGV
jgi:hypothetical protein